MMMRREVWEEVGPFDPGYRFYCQDTDLCYAAAAAGWKVAVVQSFRVMHHHGGTIMDDPGAVDRVHPGLLWSNLLRLSSRRWGPGAERAALRALKLGGRLRLLARRVIATAVPPRDPERRAAADAAYGEALRGLGRVDRSGAGSALELEP
jgi:GT2 family glycosyltransferase